MGTIHVKYDEVYAETEKLRNHISSNIMNRVNAEYRQMQSQLSHVDGAANAQLKEVLDANMQKTILAAETLDKLLQFISDSAKQIEISEQRIARTMMLGKG